MLRRHHDVTHKVRHIIRKVNRLGVFYYTLIIHDELYYKKDCAQLFFKLQKSAFPCGAISVW